MSENHEAYQQHMSAGHNAAWDQNWPAAIKAYTAAIQEMKEDPEAHIHLGLALLKSGRLEDALRVYKKAHQLAPDDPIPLEKSADVLERMGRLKEAAEQYINVADVYLKQRDLGKAIGTWERATQLTPGLVAIHAKLAQAYERIGDKKRAVREYLKLAFNFQRVKEVDKARKALERALPLEPKNSHLLNARSALDRNAPIVLPPEDDVAAKPKKEADIFDLFSEEDDERRRVGEADPLGPIGEAMTAALTSLAAFVFESGSLDAAGGDAMLGMEMQRQEQYDQAIEAYKRAEPRLRHGALKLNLGALLLLADQPQEAVKHLGEAIMDPQLAAGAFHGLGQAYFKMGDHKKASRYLIQSLQAVDTSLATSEREIADLQVIYEKLNMALDGIEDASLEQVNQRFINLLSGKEWKQRIAQTRVHLEESIRMEGDDAIRDIIFDSGDAITESVSLIDRYIRRGLFTLAMDEAHRAVEHSPYYLPVHVRMAEIMMKEGRVRQAIQKYNTVAKSYLVKGENERAASILGEVLVMAPLDVSVRKNLIELLEQEERWMESLDQYIDLANTYQQLGDFDNARETYSVSERIAARVKAPPAKLVEIKHHIVELEQLRLNTRRVVKVLEEIVEISPDDERAHRMLVDIFYSQGEQIEAIKRLDALMALYARKKQINVMTQMLEELVKQYPADNGLRSRLAAMYSRMGRKREAIEQLDALGELQLEAGLHKDAANTIRQIIALEPEHVEDYKKLLSQLGG